MIRSATPTCCGQRAALVALSDRIGTQVVFCEERDRDQYGRVVAKCRLVGDGEDLNAWLVREGLALAYREFGTDCVRQENEAKAAGRGLWTGAFTPPWEWRQNGRQVRRESGAGHHVYLQHKGDLIRRRLAVGLCSRLGGPEEADSVLQGRVLSDRPEPAG